MTGTNSSGARSASDQKSRSELEVLLQFCADYCERLVDSSFSIRCKEKIRERVTHSHINKGRILDLSADLSSRGSEVNTYVYDLHFLYNGTAREEDRVLKLENDQERNMKNAPMKTAYFEVDYMVFEPVRFLAAENHPYFAYQMIGLRKLNDREAYIVQVDSKGEWAHEEISGKVWVDKDDFSVMRMEFEMKTFGVMQGMTRAGETFPVDARRTVRVEFLTKLGTIRFPSLCHIQEILIAPSMKTIFPRAEISISYGEYRSD